LPLIATDCLFHQVRGWVTAVQKGGKERLARQHAKVDANERRLQLELWNKRLAADKAFEKALKANSGAGVHLDESVAPYKAAGALGVNNHSGVATSSLASQLLSGLAPSAVELAERLVGPSFSYEPQHASAHHGAPASSPQVGPSFSYELAADARGIAFAFGGIFPGRLHAHGELVKVHQVSYSIGAAGTYKLHVGLRQQSASLPGSPFTLNPNGPSACMCSPRRPRLPGSPFTLHVKPGPAHAPTTLMPSEQLPLSSVAGNRGAFVLRLCDNMGNLCVEGGADIKVR